MRFILGMLAFSVISVQANEIRLIKVRELGPMKHRVIYQSNDISIVKKSNVVKGKLVAQWGVHVFEVVNGLYACNSKKVCTLSTYERVATFESCITKENKVKCRNRLTGDSSSSNNSRDIVIADNPDEVSDTFNQGAGSDSEFPVRIQDEYSDLF